MKKILCAALLLAAGVAHAATFNLFSPAAGILKGNPSTYITTAAASSDVIALWTGTCNASTFLRGDGSCATAGSGTVTSVGLAVPTGLSVSGSPITTSGTITISTTLNGVIHGNGSGFTAGNVALGSEVSGNLPVANLNSGTGASGTTFWRGDGTWGTPAGAGTVTSVGIAAPAIFSISGSPVTNSGTLTLTATGTAGGIPYFDTASTLVSSFALDANKIVLGGGPGSSPDVVGSLGTTTTLLHGNAAGKPTWSAVSLANDVTGNLAVSHLNSGTGATGSTFWRGDGTWAAASGAAFSGAYTISTVNRTCAQGGICNINYGAENYDTGNFHDNSTNPDQITLPSGSGYAQCSMGAVLSSPSTSAANTNHPWQVYIYKNGQSIGTNVVMNTNTIFHNTAGQSDVLYMSATSPVMTANGTDYAVAAFGSQNYTSGSSTAVINSGSSPTFFECHAVN